jgi:hypothetical protein
MNAFALLLLPIALVSAEARPARCDLHITIRAHADRVVFGDPLYVEMTIVNESEDPVSGPPPDDMFITSWFMVSSMDKSGLSYSNHYEYGCPMRGGIRPIVFQPHQPVKYYLRVFLPFYHRFDHPFWSRYHGGGRVVVLAVYPLRTGWALGSCEVALEGRPESQIEAIRHWAEPQFNREDYEKGPTPADFWLPVYIANREEMAEFASRAALSGELGDLVDLSLLFRDLYELPPESREQANRELVEWLRKEPDVLHHFGGAESMISDVERERLQKQFDRTHSDSNYYFLGAEGGIERVRYYPEVKRQVLARELRSLAEGYNMRSTADAIQTGGAKRGVEKVPDTKSR